MTLGLQCYPTLFQGAERQFGSGSCIFTANDEVGICQYSIAIHNMMHQAIGIYNQFEVYPLIAIVRLSMTGISMRDIAFTININLSARSACTSRRAGLASNWASMETGKNWSFSILSGVCA